jgi:allantoate deiminase
VSECGYAPHTLVSGAGHDAVALSALTPVAMLFVRCKDGVSHHPAESVMTDDVAAAIDVLDRFLDLLTRDTNRR